MYTIVKTKPLRSSSEDEVSWENSSDIAKEPPIAPTFTVSIYNSINRYFYHCDVLDYI